MNKKKAKNLSVALGLIVAALRFYFESRIPLLVHPDAQGGIWIAYAVVASGITFFVVSILAYLALRTLKRKRRIAVIACALLVIFAITWTGERVIELREMEIALQDAKNPDTEPARLKELIEYEKMSGYEIDNRIASNPSTPADLLRKLYEIPGQLGTKMHLARNPNTPDDILVSLMKSEDKLIQEHLKLNPKFQELEIQQVASGQRR